MKKIIFLLFLFQIFSVKTILASENVVINEFLPNPTIGNDWIELYNPTSADIDIGGWILRDLATTKMKTFSSGTIIKSHDFILEYVSSRLGNSGDTIFLKMPDDIQEIDSKIYSGPQVPDVSIGRNPDGANNWVTFNNPTPGFSNNPSSPTPTAIPTEIPSATPTQEPTSTPTSTPIPTETPTMTPIISPTIEPSPTVTPQITLTPTPTIIIAPLTPPMNIHEILEKRMQCRFSYSRFARLPNGAMIIDLLKSVFGQNSVCSS